MYFTWCIIACMYNDIVLKLLEITEYKDDKKAFLEDFTRITNSQALVTLVQMLPEEKRETADAEIAGADSQEKFTEVVRAHFTEEQVQEALDNAAAEAVTQWIQSVAPTLNDTQKKKLVELSIDLQRQMETSSK